MEVRHSVKRKRIPQELAAPREIVLLPPGEGRPEGPDEGFSGPWLPRPASASQVYAQLRNDEEDSEDEPNKEPLLGPQSEHLHSAYFSEI